ncbi:hypothetical protein K438DRAFT_1772386 [Mycena galopus ATCC 62051]|nr:hypothetical protein K438DRAFT_1772386 [Mycena galopus ATCC 62051]
MAKEVKDEPSMKASAKTKLKGLSDTRGNSLFRGLQKRFRNFKYLNRFREQCQRPKTVPETISFGNSFGEASLLCVMRENWRYPEQNQCHTLVVPKYAKATHVDSRPTFQAERSTPGRSSRKACPGWSKSKSTSKAGCEDARGGDLERWFKWEGLRGKATVDQKRAASPRASQGWAGVLKDERGAAAKVWAIIGARTKKNVEERRFKPDESILGAFSGQWLKLKSRISLQCFGDPAYSQAERGLKYVQSAGVEIEYVERANWTHSVPLKMKLVYAFLPEQRRWTRTEIELGGKTRAVQTDVEVAHSPPNFEFEMECQLPGRVEGQQQRQSSEKIQKTRHHLSLRAYDISKHAVKGAPLHMHHLFVDAPALFSI